MKSFNTPEPKINLNRVTKNFEINLGYQLEKDEILDVINQDGFQFIGAGNDDYIFAIVYREETDEEYNYRVSCEKSKHVSWENAKNTHNKKLHEFEEEQALKNRKKIAKSSVYKNPAFIEFLRQTKVFQETYGKLVLPMNNSAWKNDEYQAYMENANKFLKDGYEDFLPKEIVTFLKAFQ